MRKPRLLMDSATYHVTARANRSEFILKQNIEKELFLNILRKAKKKYRFTIKSFCIMGNHIHLMIKPLGKENLSQIMQWVLSVFALSFNRKYGYKGHVWYDRFHSTIIQSASYFIKVFGYIAENPVKAQICSKAEDYTYSSCWIKKEAYFDFIEPPDELARMFFPEISQLYLPDRS